MPASEITLRVLKIRRAPAGWKPADRPPGMAALGVGKMPTIKIGTLLIGGVGLC
jgi:hypothetical protein